MAFSLKKLIYSEEELSKDKPEQEPQTINKFPDIQTSSNNFLDIIPSIQQPILPADITNNHLNKFIEMYQTGFDNLNQSGYDFFEFFQGILSSNGVDNPQAYTMTMNILKGMDKTMNQEKLLSQAEFYITELNNVYNKYVGSGTAKKQGLLTQKETETNGLNAELNNLRIQLESIKQQILTKENEIANIDNKYSLPLKDMDQKLKANDFAKDKIMVNLLKVKQGIINFLK